MENSNIKQEEKANNKSSIFKNSSILVRISFIVGVVSLLITAILFILMFSIQPYYWILYIIYSILIATGIGGITLSSIAFRNGKNVYNILGFIFNLIIVILFIIAIVVLAITVI